MPRVRYERQGDVGLVVLDDPPLNLFGSELTGDLVAALDEAEGDMPRALVVRAEGRVFTGGVDVQEFAGLTHEQGAALFGDLVKIVHKLEGMPIPTIASVHALCLTAGFELALGCDILLAAEAAGFGLVERVVGLTPGMGGTQRVAERAGPARARELVMTGELFDAATLERWNVVNRVYPDDALQEQTMKFAEQLAAGPPKAHDATKRMVRAYLDEGGPRGADAHVGDIAASLFATEDLQNAVQTFLAEGPGKAKFQGR
ncbi:MAG TPA: enoyl-CoA hydratase/isomerase family protein [Thermoleophilaceae bacterium]|nr:enoyl-CoA hydratase/isomerase family protein [Thermoleophilaceae bacterium]